MTDAAPREAYLPYLPGSTPGAGPRPLADIMADLRRPVHRDFLETKVKKGTEITFISWHTAARILDKYAPGWQYPAPAVVINPTGQVVVSVQIGIPTSDYGLLWRGATGWDEDEEKAYGEASDRAESAALRRAAAKWGLCRYLYYERGANGPTQLHPPPVPGATPTEAPAPRPPAPPAAASGSPAAGVGPSAPPDGLPAPAGIRPEQLRTITGLLGPAGMSASALCDTYGVEAVGALSAVQALDAITRLQRRADALAAQRKAGAAA